MPKKDGRSGKDRNSHQEGFTPFQTSGEQQQRQIQQFQQLLQQQLQQQQPLPQQGHQLPAYYNPQPPQPQQGIPQQQPLQEGQFAYHDPFQQPQPQQEAPRNYGLEIEKKQLELQIIQMKQEIYRLEIKIEQKEQGIAQSNEVNMKSINICERQQLMLNAQMAILAREGIAVTADNSGNFLATNSRGESYRVSVLSNGKTFISQPIEQAGVQPIVVPVPQPPSAAAAAAAADPVTPPRTTSRWPQSQ